MEMTITETQPTRALLVEADTGDYDAEASLDELFELAESAGAEPVASITQKLQHIDPATCVGSGKLEEIKDYCYSVSVNPINGEIAAGQYVVIDGEEYKITCVGYEAPITLKGLGHCTFNLNGATEAELPGTIYMESKPMPDIKIGTVIKIIEK